MELTQLKKMEKKEEKGKRRMEIQKIRNQEKELDCQVIKSDRKTLAIEISRKNGVVVRAPRYMKQQEIWKILKEKSAWIFAKEAELKKQTELLEQRNLQYGSGEKIPFLGKEYLLCISENKANRSCYIKTQENRLEIVTPDLEVSVLKEAIHRWYIEQAGIVTAQRTAFYAEKMGVSYGRITIRSQKTRWGSCSAKGNLNFNWNLILFPLEILDYVVVHELAHRKEMNHSAAFWKEVEAILPDYKERRSFLKKQVIR